MEISAFLFLKQSYYIGVTYLWWTTTLPCVVDGNKEGYQALCGKNGDDSEETARGRSNEWYKQRKTIASNLFLFGEVEIVEESISSHTRLFGNQWDAIVRRPRWTHQKQSKASEPNHRLQWHHHQTNKDSISNPRISGFFSLQESTTHFRWLCSVITEQPVKLLNYWLNVWFTY